MDVSASQLTGKLKHLRLSGVLDTLSARERQAIEGKWSYLAFLEQLLEDEVERRAQKQLALRLTAPAAERERAKLAVDPVSERPELAALPLAPAPRFQPASLPLPLGAKHRFRARSRLKQNHLHRKAWWRLGLQSRHSVVGWALKPLRLGLDRPHGFLPEPRLDSSVDESR